MMRSGNPTLNANTFAGLHATEDDRMTLMGTVHKTFILLAIVTVSAALTWDKFYKGDPNLYAWMIGGAVVGLIIALATFFKPVWAPVTAPLYCAAKGLFLGVVSAVFEKMYPGIVVQAVALTFGVLFALLGAYRSGLIKATENFRLGVCAATGGIFLLYMVNFIMHMFGSGIPFIHESGTFGICFSLFVVVIAALNLVLDFDFIEEGAESGAPKYMEWFGAFGLMVTLIWLYLEILHLLAKLRE